VRTIELESRWLRATILPDVGAKIYDLVHKPTGRAVLWHNPRIEPQPYPVDGLFDNYWCGGWDDAFPTCDAFSPYPDLGELRALRWKVDDATPNSATLSAYGPISPVHVTKRVSLDSDAAILRMSHSITNLGPKPLDFIWGTHPALNVSPGTILRIPARNAIVSEASCRAFGEPGERYDWPRLGAVDMSKVPDAGTGEYCGHYAVDLEAGWYEVEDTQTGCGFRLDFPVEICKVLWLWLNYGGYRGLYHVIVEPWTSIPVHLGEAIRRGTSLRLPPGGVFDVAVAATVYSREREGETTR